MNIQISAENDILLHAVKQQCRLPVITFQSLIDLGPFLKRTPNLIHLRSGIPNTPFAKYDVNMDRLEINLHPIMLKPLYGDGSFESRDISLRGILNHEFFESISYSPAESQIKRLATSTFSALTNFVANLGSNSNGIMPLFNTPEGLSLMIDDISQDIKVDRTLLNLKHYPKSFNFGHRHYVENDKFQLKHLEITKKGQKYSSNISPYKILYVVMPAMRRSVISKDIRDKKSFTYGGFRLCVNDYIIGKRIKFPELQNILREIDDKFAQKSHHKSKIRELANEFIAKFN